MDPGHVPCQLPFWHGLIKEPSLLREVRFELRQTFDKHCRANARQLTRLNLVQSATVNPAFASEFIAGDLSKQRVDERGTIRMAANHDREAVPRVEHEVQICCDRLRTIPDETKRLFLVGTTAQVGAQERRRLALPLLV